MMQEYILAVYGIGCVCVWNILKHVNTMVYVCMYVHFSLTYWISYYIFMYSLIFKLHFLKAQIVRYIVVFNFCFVILSNCFYWQLCRLGRHAPIQRVLRNGIMRISKVAASKVANEPLEEWFSLLGDSHMSTKLKVYAQVSSWMTAVLILLYCILTLDTSM